LYPGPKRRNTRFPDVRARPKVYYNPLSTSTPDMTATLVWFRRDLRLADHAALAYALDTGGPAFVIELDLRSLERASERVDRRLRLPRPGSSLGPREHPALAALPEEERADLVTARRAPEVFTCGLPRGEVEAHHVNARREARRAERRERRGILARGAAFVLARGGEVKGRVVGVGQDEILFVVELEPGLALRFEGRLGRERALGPNPKDREPRRRREEGVLTLFVGEEWVAYGYEVRRQFESWRSQRRGLNGAANGHGHPNGNSHSADEPVYDEEDVPV